MFVGLFADGLCDFEVPSSTLRRLGAAGISVRMDYYGVEQGEAIGKAETGGEPEPPILPTCVPM